MLDAAIALAPDLGWNAAMLAKAAAKAGLSHGEAMLLLPNGARDLAALLSARHDQAALNGLAAVDPKALKMRERIRQGVEARLDAAEADEAAVRRWAGFLALPLQPAPGAAADLGKRGRDLALGRRHGHRREPLFQARHPLRHPDRHPGHPPARGPPTPATEYLGARIDNVMAFEKWKAGVKPADVARDIAAALGRLRYGRS